MREVGGRKRYSEKWSPFIMIDTVSETQRISWKEATALNVYEFLNTLCYRIDKENHNAAVRKAEMDKIQAKRRM